MTKTLKISVCGKPNKPKKTKFFKQKMLFPQLEHWYILCSSCITKFIAVIIPEMTDDIFG